MMEASSIHAKKEILLQSVKLFRPIDIAVILSSIIALYLFRLQDGHELNPIWQLKQPSNNKCLIHAQPLITDLDGNGLKELIISSEDRIEIFSYHADELDESPSEHLGDDDATTQAVLFHLHLKNEIKFAEIIGMDGGSGTHPVVMNTGCLTVSSNNLCSQALAIVWNDWTVTLLSYQLKILWKSRPLKITFLPKLQITEMTIWIGNGNSSVFGDDGLVIVGGVLNPKEHSTHGDTPRHDHFRPTNPSENSDEISKARAGVKPNAHGSSHDLHPDTTRYVGHFTTFALDGKTGEVKWKHEPGDFVDDEELDEEKQSQLHFKLRLKKKRLHYGEVHWKKYSRSFLNHLPYSWSHYTDTSITLGDFNRSPASKPSQNHIIPEELLAFARRSNTFKQSNIKPGVQANVVVIHRQHAIEVLNLENGSPLCMLPLDGAKLSSLGDVNGDESIDIVKMSIYEESLSHTSSCFLVATDGLGSSVHFNASVCNPSSVFGFDTKVDTSGYQDKKLHRLPPLLLKPLHRSSGVLHHVLGYGLSPVNAGLESFVLLPSGKLSALGPSGRLLWEVKVGFTWLDMDHFYPSMRPVSLNVEGQEDAVVILGPRDIIGISLVDGSVVSTHTLPCHSTQPLVSGDINNDGSDEFLVRCDGRYIGFSLERYNRIGLTLIVYSGVACLVVFLLFVLKFIEREEFPLDTFAHALESMRLFPAYGPRL